MRVQVLQGAVCELHKVEHKPRGTSASLVLPSSFGFVRLLDEFRMYESRIVG